MNWNLDDARPIWLQLNEKLTWSIVSGAYPPGGRLPSVRDLAAEAGVNPNTMQRALAQLETDGLAESNRTAGRTVTEHSDRIEAVRRRLADSKMAEFLQAMSRLGFSREEAAAMLQEEEPHE